MKRDYGSEQECRGASQEDKHPLDQLRLQLAQAVLELRIEPAEVGFKEFPELGSICFVYLVEPIDQLVGHLVSELGVEFLGKLGCNRHETSVISTGTMLNIR